MGDLHIDTRRFGPLSYNEEPFWREFGTDRETFIKRGTLIEVPLDDDIGMDALRSIVHTLTARHEILRTVYQTVDGLPARKVMPS